MEEKLILSWFGILAQMDLILSAYRKSSKQWSSTLNKLAQGVALLFYSPFLCWFSAFFFFLMSPFNSIAYMNCSATKRQEAYNGWLAAFSNVCAILRQENEMFM